MNSPTARIVSPFCLRAPPVCFRSRLILWTFARRTTAPQRRRRAGSGAPSARKAFYPTGKEVSSDPSHLNSSSCTLRPCRTHFPQPMRYSCRCCQPLRSPRPFTRGTSITGMATASYPAIISHPTTFQFMVRRGQSAALKAIRHATDFTAGGTISAIQDFTVDATTAAVLARAGFGRPSGRCGIVGRRLGA